MSSRSSSATVQPRNGRQVARQVRNKGNKLAFCSSLMQRLNIKRTRQLLSHSDPPYVLHLPEHNVRNHCNTALHTNCELCTAPGHSEASVSRLQSKQICVLTLTILADGKISKSFSTAFQHIGVSWEAWNAQRLRGPGGGPDPHQGLQQVLPAAARTSHAAHRARYGILRKKALFLLAFKFALPETVILQCLWLPVQTRGSINNSKWMCVTGMHTQTRVSLYEINSKWDKTTWLFKKRQLSSCRKTSTRSQGTSILFFAVSSVS